MTEDRDDTVHIDRDRDCLDQRNRDIFRGEFYYVTTALFKCLNRIQIASLIKNKTLYLYYEHCKLRLIF